MARFHGSLLGSEISITDSGLVGLARRLANLALAEARSEMYLSFSFCSAGVILSMEKALIAFSNESISLSGWCSPYKHQTTIRRDDLDTLNDNDGSPYMQSPSGPMLLHIRDQVQ